MYLAEIEEYNICAYVLLKTFSRYIKCVCKSGNVYNILYYILLVYYAWILNDLD